ncbi:MAG: o-succinylbenzoate synthase [Actinobacteria bacterium]|nr:o-succinylbenzoate synthase [Actinomycetota bacterium]
MKIDAAELRVVRLPLVIPFRTSQASQTERVALLVRVITGQAEGWAECGASPEPFYEPEFLSGARAVIAEHLLPMLMQAPDVTAARVQPLLAQVKGNEMAKAALETAVLDAELRAAGMSFARYLGAVTDRVPAGVSVGIPGSLTELLSQVEAYLEQGYQRIKLKIEPGWDTEPVRAVRERFGPDLALQVDANQAYSRHDARRLRALDEFGLLLVEQPLAADDLPGHAELARALATPVCLDESVTSLRLAAAALELRACSVLNIKPARVGGYLTARAIHDLCVAHGVPVWCGGLLETGVGRAANLALAALPGFTLPGDVSATARYFAEDITAPFVLEDGHIRVPAGPGTGVEVIMDVLERLTVSCELLC